MKVPFLDLKLVNEPYETEIARAVSSCISSGWYVLGESGKKFEEKYAAFCKSTYCIGTANGLDAISLILKACDFPIDSEIIVPSNTYIATILGILNAGLKPVLVEPNAETYLLDPQNIEKCLSPQTKAIFTVALYGKHGDLIGLRKIADKFALKLFSDNAQSHGATYHKEPSEKWLDAAAYSFYPTKNLGAMGDAGAVVTNDEALATRIGYLRNYGSKIKYQFDYQGINSRLDEIQAAILSVKLPYLQSALSRRRSIARRYLTEIKTPCLTLPPADSVDEDAWHLFTVMCEHRNEFRQFLLERGVASDVHYPSPPHKQAALKEYEGMVFPITERIHKEITSIPLNQTLTDEQVSYVISTINSFSV